jgi:NAD(P)-dependent dehydrogenase (short-subunit alcohol dehydrogenase family)
VSISLEGKTILVTGAGSGIGKSVAEAVAAAGADVVVTDVAGQDDTAAAIIKEGGLAEAQELDVTNALAWRDVVNDALSANGRIDGLANVAGIVSDKDSLLTQDEDGWQRIIDVDLKGAFLGMQAVVPSMLSGGGGKIVNVASVAGLIGMPNVVTYSAAKGGIIAMSRQIAVEYAAQGLRVNTIAPGVTKTNMLGDITEELLGQVKAATPTQRIGEPSDVGNLITYLLGPGSDFITGQVFPVDGGWTAQ